MTRTCRVARRSLVLSPALGAQPRTTTTTTSVLYTHTKALGTRNVSLHQSSGTSIERPPCRRRDHSTALPVPLRRLPPSAVKRPSTRDSAGTAVHARTCTGPAAASPRGRRRRRRRRPRAGSVRRRTNQAASECDVPRYRARLDDAARQALPPREYLLTYLLMSLFTRGTKIEDRAFTF